RGRPPAPPARGLPARPPRARHALPGPGACAACAARARPPARYRSGARAPCRHPGEPPPCRATRSGSPWRCPGCVLRCSFRRRLLLHCTTAVRPAPLDLELLDMKSLFRLDQDLLLEPFFQLVDVLLLDGDQDVGDLGGADDDQ